MSDALKDLLEKYRSMKLSYRIILVIILALLYPAIKFSEESTLKTDKLAAAKSAESSTNAEYKKSVDKTEELPALERDIKFIQDELNEAVKKLPNEINIADDLSSITVAARRSGVELYNFTPLEEEKPEEGLKYTEKGIDIKVRGLYRDIGDFLDKVVHFERLMFVDNANFSLSNSDQNEQYANLSAFESAKLRRRNIMLNADVKLIIYKSVD